MSKPKTRDQQATAAVECPQCHAAAGQPCRVLGQPMPTLDGLPFCHYARRAEWEKKQARIAFGERLRQAEKELEAKHEGRGQRTEGAKGT